MFHLFTLQGKRIDAQLEHFPKNVRVHHSKNSNRAKKFEEGDSSPQGSGINSQGSYGAGVYKEASRMENEKTPVFHASSIMSSPVLMVDPEISVNEAWIKFQEKKVHHMPVVTEKGEIVGIVSDRDLLKHLIINDGVVETSRNAAVGDIMSTDVIATTPLTDIRRIAKVMLDNHIGAMPVVNPDGSIAGIITRSDILYAIIHQPELKLWA
jgi:CBS domain-containing protein